MAPFQPPRPPIVAPPPPCWFPHRPHQSPAVPYALPRMIDHALRSIHTGTPR